MSKRRQNQEILFGNQVCVTIELEFLEGYPQERFDTLRGKQTSLKVVFKRLQQGNKKVSLKTLA